MITSAPSTKSGLRVSVSWWHTSRKLWRYVVHASSDILHHSQQALANGIRGYKTQVRLRGLEKNQEL